MEEVLSKVFADHGSAAYQRAKTAYESLAVTPPTYMYDGDSTIAHWPLHHLYFYTFLYEVNDDHVGDDRILYSAQGAMSKDFENLEDALEHVRSLLI